MIFSDCGCLDSSYRRTASSSLLIIVDGKRFDFLDRIMGHMCDEFQEAAEIIVYLDVSKLYRPLQNSSVDFSQSFGYVYDFLNITWFAECADCFRKSRIDKDIRRFHKRFHLFEFPLHPFDDFSGVTKSH